MRALDRKLEKTGDIQYSRANVSVEELQKSGRVESVDELMLQESMHYFDKYCREYGVKYSALKTKQLGEDGTEKEGYMIFFEGRNDKLIEDILRRAVADWRKDMAQAKEAGKDTAREAAEGAKPSVLAKLAFFRNRIKKSVDAEQDKNKGRNAERTHQKPDLER
ncbi:MAG: PcfB family protein [Lachnospiraceae bacterium]|nr:PcfB family protein [Lachnospiraceae bacterium]